MPISHTYFLSGGLVIRQRRKGAGVEIFHAGQWRDYPTFDPLYHNLKPLTAKRAKQLTRVAQIQLFQDDNGWPNESYSTAHAPKGGIVLDHPYKGGQFTPGKQQSLLREAAGNFTRTGASEAELALKPSRHDSVTTIHGDGRLTGVVSHWTDADEALTEGVPAGPFIRIRNMASAESGHGRKLFESVLEHAAAQKAGVYLSSLESSRGFYEKLGMHGATGSIYYLTPAEVADRVNVAKPTRIQNRDAWFGQSRVVNDDGTPRRVFHGAQRPDRIGNEFKAERATSGPMAFFTDDPDIASGYATGKRDTSLEAPADYSGWFKVNTPRGVRELDQAWLALPADERDLLTKNLPHVTNTTPEGDELPDDTYNLGGEDEHGLAGRDTWEWEIKQARGNVLKAAKEIWLASAGLFGREEEFLKVLRTAGMKTRVDYDDPNASHSAIFPVYLSIQNPLDTAAIPAKVFTALRKASVGKQASDPMAAGDQWDKRTVTGKEWYARLREDKANGTTHAWTSIPDYATETLRAMGYDGIKDKGGKMGGRESTVWIPFDATQIKSASGNAGNYDLSNPNIRFSIEDDLAPEQVTQRDALAKELLVQRSTLSGAAIVAAMNRRIQTILLKKNGQDALNEVIRLLEHFRPLLIGTIYESKVAGFFLGADSAAKRAIQNATPKWVGQPRRKDAQGELTFDVPPPPEEPPVTDLLFPEGEGPVAHLDFIETAWRDLKARRPLLPVEYYELGVQGKADAFTVTAGLERDTIQAIGRLLAKDVEQGTSRKLFAKAVREALPGLPVSNSHLENVYRTNVMTAFTTGAEKVYGDPVVKAVYPLRYFNPIHDTRQRPVHGSFEHKGLMMQSGERGAFYWADDPLWQLILPPIHFQCRCSYTAMDIATCRAMGVIIEPGAPREWVPIEQYDQGDFFKPVPAPAPSRFAIGVAA